MNYKSIFIILLITTFIATLFVTVKKPEMHKVALIYNSDYKIVNNETPQKEERNIPTIVQEEQTISVQQRLQNNVEQVEKITPPKVTTVKQEASKPQTKTVAVSTKKEKAIQQPQVKTVSQTPKTVQQTKTVSQPKKVEQVKSVETPKKSEQIKVVEVPKKVEVQKSSNVTVPAKTTQTTVQQKPTVLTKEQEEIAWNVWRSNLQNQIMKDTHLPSVPNGTIFRFSFDVDKYGKVSNIQTYSDTKMYTPYAIQYIAPVIRSYQGKSILNFPAGTARVTTTAKGAWKISSNTKYSTPKDFNDTEVIQR